MKYLLYFDPSTTDDITIKDRTKYKNDGTLGGAGYAAFDGAAYAVGSSDTDIYDADYVPFHATFRTTAIGEIILISRWGFAPSEYSFILSVSNGNLSVTLSVASSGDIIETGLNDGNWHSVTGVFTPGLISGELDGVQFSVATIYQSVLTPVYPIGIQARKVATAPAGRNVVDIASCGLGTENFYFSQNWGTGIYEENGGETAQLMSATQSLFRKNDTGSDVYPRNFHKGFKLFENGTPGEEILTPLTNTVTPSGYTLTAVIPPYVFGPWEGWFSVPYSSDLAAKDVNGKLYTGTTPNKLYFAELKAGGFGPYIEYSDFGGYYKGFLVKK